MLFNAMLVFVGGGLGAVSRYLVTTFMGNHVGGSFPYGTFAANIIGSFCMGAVMFYFINKSLPVPEHRRLRLWVGLRGGCTTLSSVSMETVSLMQNQHVMSSMLNVVGNVSLGVGAMLMGMFAANWLS